MDFILGECKLMSDCGCPTFTLHGSSTALIFPVPEWANPDNEITKNVAVFNFKSGDIDTVDRGINTQPLAIGGTVCICGMWEGLCFPLCFPLCFSAPLTTWLESIRDAMNNGEEFTINELGDCLNGVYVIKDFTFDTIQGTPECFSWGLRLERVKDI